MVEVMVYVLMFECESLGVVWIMVLLGDMLVF